MANVFISFRRQDTHDMAWRLLDYLEGQGQETLYDMDWLYPAFKGNRIFLDC